MTETMTDAIQESYELQTVQVNYGTNNIPTAAITDETANR